MNKKIFSFNWLYRNDDGVLYGFKYRPGIKSFSFPPGIKRMDMESLPKRDIRVINTLNPVPRDYPRIIKETDKSLDFIKRSKLYHVTDLCKEDSFLIEEES